MITQVKLVDSAREVREAVAEFTRAGYVKDTIFILTHDERRTESLAEVTDIHEIGMIDEGVFNAVANLFRWGGNLNFDPEEGDPNIVYSPSAMQLNNNIL
jgi:hypothetical protein